MVGELPPAPTLTKRSSGRTSKIIWSQSALQWIFDAINRGLTAPQMAAAFKISPSAIYGIINQHTTLRRAWNGDTDGGGYMPAISTREAAFIRAGAGMAKDVVIKHPSAKKKLPHWGPIGDLTSIPVGRRSLPIPTVNKK